MVEFDVERLKVNFRPNTHQTEVVIRLNDEDYRRMDRQQFRRQVIEKLNEAGDWLMAVWDKLHEEQA